VKTISEPLGQKKSHFASREESCNYLEKNRDVERKFGVLQLLFATVRYTALTWSHEEMWEVINASVFLPNMIIETMRNNPAMDEHHV
jgi:hypothetical protein